MFVVPVASHESHASCADLKSFQSNFSSHLFFQVLKQLRIQHNQAFTNSKFAKATISYLGRIAGQGVVCPQHAKVQAIDEYAPPATKKELMRFLGLVGFSRCFCRNFAAVVAPPTNLLKAKVCVLDCI